MRASAGAVVYANPPCIGPKVSITILDSVFVNNIGQTSGAIQTTLAAEVYIQNSLFESNFAHRGSGGALLLEDSDFSGRNDASLVVKNSVFRGNSVDGGQGGST